MFLERESLIKSAPNSRTEIDKDNYVTTIQLDVKFWFLNMFWSDESHFYLVNV